MKRILLPVEETTRSLTALTQVKKLFAPDEVEIVLLMIDESVDYTASREAAEQAMDLLEKKLDLVEATLEGYYVIKKADMGKAGQRIVKCAREFGADLIVMTKSAKDENKNVVGKTAEYVISHAECNVMIATETEAVEREYRGLVYRKAEALVNLRGQFSFKQSECIIPSVSSDCIYHFDVKRGKIRFIHRSFNPVTRDWDLPPVLDDVEVQDILAGESVDILVRANSVEGKADRIRIVNRNTKTEAVFNYRITAANTDAE